MTTAEFVTLAIRKMMAEDTDIGIDADKAALATLEFVNAVVLRCREDAGFGTATGYQFQVGIALEKWRGYWHGEGVSAPNY